MAPSTVVLITGANSGIGFATSKVITSSSDKYHVIVTGRTIEKAENAVKEIQAKGDIKGTLSALQLDQTDEESVKRAAAAVEKEFGRLDVLINNAAKASIEGADFDKDMYKFFVELFATNVAGPYLVSRTFRPLLAKSADPRSIYVSSAMGCQEYVNANFTEPTPWGEAIIPYPATKAALNMVATYEKIEMGGKYATKIFLMCPGLVVSNIRGTSDEMRNMGGAAGDPEVSGQTILSIMEGKRDADIGKGVIHKDGVYGW